MSDYLVIPPGPLRGRVRVPSSKSATNRALMAAALGPTPVEIVFPLESDDTAAMVRCLRAMGAAIARAADGLRVSGPLGRPAGTEVVLDAGDSGTAARFLTAAAAAVPGRFRITGSERLRERPMAELVTALRRAGARVTYLEREGFAPLGIEGASLGSGAVTVDASRSSQFLSAILIAGVAVDGGLEARPAGPVASAPYVDTTVNVLRALGHEAAAGEGGAFRVRRGARPAARYETPADWSSAIPLMACVASAGGQVRLEGLTLPSSDADARALPVLQSMGLSVVADGAALTALAPASGRLRPISVDASAYPDAVPSLAALAGLAEGASVVSGVAHLRLKESDRIDALARLLTDAGARADAGPGTLSVTGPAVPAGGAVRLSSRGDHRIAMAAAILSLRVPGLMVEDPGCVAKSYPRFFRDLDSLR